MTRSTANGVGLRHTVRRVRSRRQASTATGMAPTSAFGAARQAQARPAPSARPVGTRSNWPLIAKWREAYIEAYDGKHGKGTYERALAEFNDKAEKKGK